MLLGGAGGVGGVDGGVVGGTGCVGGVVPLPPKIETLSIPRKS